MPYFPLVLLMISLTSILDQNEERMIVHTSLAWLGGLGDLVGSWYGCLELFEVVVLSNS